MDSIEDRLMLLPQRVYCFYAGARYDFAEADILTDMLFNAKFDESDVAKGGA